MVAHETTQLSQQTEKRDFLERELSKVKKKRRHIIIALDEQRRHHTKAKAHIKTVVSHMSNFLCVFWLFGSFFFFWMCYFIEVKRLPSQGLIITMIS